MSRKCSYRRAPSTHVTDESLVQQTSAPGISIYRSAELLNGKRVAIHTKFIVIDPEVLFLASANFSITAQFGFFIRDSAPLRVRSWSKSRSASGEDRRRPEFVLSPCRAADEVETVTSCAMEGQTKTST